MFCNKDCILAHEHRLQVVLGEDRQGFSSIMLRTRSGHGKADRGLSPSGQRLGLGLPCQAATQEVAQRRQASPIQLVPSRLVA